MLAELFNAMVSKLFVNEYRDLAEYYLHLYRRVTGEKQQLEHALACHRVTIKDLEQECRAAKAEVQELQTTVKTAQRRDSSGSDEQKQLLNAAMMNIAAKETIIRLQTDLRCKTLELERCRKAAENEKAFHDCTVTERDRLLQEKYKLLLAAATMLSSADYEKLKGTIGGVDFANLMSAMKATQ